MAPYFHVVVFRTDGMLQTATKSGVDELNQPTKAQQDDTPDANGNVDCYRKLEPDDLKAVDWRRKLGGMLMNLLAGNLKQHKDRNYILKELPEGYVLWEHVKYNVNKMEDNKKEKGKHAAGVYERQDAYLYGHPDGRKKRFRSPADFFSHLLWLATDPDGNHRNCSCKICSPDGDEDVVNEPAKIEAPAKKETKITPAIYSAPKNTPIPTAPNPPMKPAIQPAPQVAVRSLEQTADSDPHSKYIYRPGECVWFYNGSNWRLGVIGKRGLLNGAPQYFLQPLSNPYQHQPPLIQQKQDLLRPWLAWSVPETTVAALKDMSYDTVPWDRVVRGEFNQGQVQDYVVDGSILAAKFIDSSYSLFDRDESAIAGHGEVHYRGMFLGTEKIWVGEPVRLRVPSAEIVVLIIQRLIEHTTPPSTSSVTFVGDVYKFVEMPTPYESRDQWPTPGLPPRMAMDLRFRNEVADQAQTGIWCEWRLLEPAARKSLSDIKGRWYETKTLLPILRGEQEYQNDIRRGRTSDSGAWMNGRRDNNLVPERRRKNRRETFGRAVPDDFKISRGLDGAPADDLFPDQQLQMPKLHPDVQGDFNQFVNLDPPVFRQEHDLYGNQFGR